MDLGSVVGIGAALSGARIEAQFTASALKMQLNITQSVGENAIKLIQAAVVDPAQGQGLDIRI